MCPFMNFSGYMVSSGIAGSHGTVFLVFLRKWASLRAQLVKNPPAMQRPRFSSWGGMIRWRRDRLPTPVFLGFPGSSEGKESACSAGDLGSIPELGRFPGKGNSYPLQYSELDNSLDCIVHRALKESDTTEQLSLFHIVFHNGYTIYIPSNTVGRFSLCHALSSIHCF